MKTKNIGLLVAFSALAIQLPTVSEAKILSVQVPATCIYTSENTGGPIRNDFRWPVAIVHPSQGFLADINLSINENGLAVKIEPVRKLTNQFGTLAKLALERNTSVFHAAYDKKFLFNSTVGPAEENSAGFRTVSLQGKKRAGTLDKATGAVTNIVRYDLEVSGRYVLSKRTVGIKREAVSCQFSRSRLDFENFRAQIGQLPDTTTPINIPLQWTY